MQPESAWALDTITEIVGQIAHEKVRLIHVVVDNPPVGRFIVVDICERNPFTDIRDSVASYARITSLAILKETGTVFSYHNKIQVDESLPLNYTLLEKGIKKAINKLP